MVLLLRVTKIGRTSSLLDVEGIKSCNKKSVVSKPKLPWSSRTCFISIFRNLRITQKNNFPREKLQLVVPATRVYRTLTSKVSTLQVSSFDIGSASVHSGLGSQKSLGSGWRGPASQNSTLLMLNCTFAKQRKKSQSCTRKRTLHQQMHPSMGTCSTSTIHPCNSFLGWNCYKQHDLYGENDWNSSMILKKDPLDTTLEHNNKMIKDYKMLKTQKQWNNTDDIHRVAFNILQSCCHSLNLRMEQSDVWTNSLPQIDRGGVAKVVDWLGKSLMWKESRWYKKSLPRSLIPQAHSPRMGPRWWIHREAGKWNAKEAHKMNQTSNKIPQASNIEWRQQLDKGPSGNKAMRVPSQPRTLNDPKPHLPRLAPPGTACAIHGCVQCPLLRCWPSACGAIPRRRSGAQAWHLVHKANALHEPCGIVRAIVPVVPLYLCLKAI